MSVTRVGTDVWACIAEWLTVQDRCRLQETSRYFRETARLSKMWRRAQDVHCVPMTVLRRWTQVTRLSFTPRTGVDLRVINRLTKLTALQLPRRPFTRLNQLDKLTQLRAFDVQHTYLVDAWAIGDWSGLRDLQLAGCTLDPGTSFSWLRRLQHLEHLDLSYTAFSSLCDVAGLTKLKSLNVRNTKVKSLRGLTRLTNLEYLDVSRSWVRSVQEVAGLPKLKTLILDSSTITDLTPLAKLPNLRVNNLASVRQTPDHLYSVCDSSQIRQATVHFTGDISSFLGITPAERFLCR